MRFSVRIKSACNKNENFTLLNFLFLDLVEREIKEVILDIKYPATKRQVSAHVNVPAERLSRAPPRDIFVVLFPPPHGTGSLLLVLLFMFVLSDVPMWNFLLSL